MNIISYIHPIRTYLPCSGIGRHINQVLLGLNQQKNIDLKLIFARQWLQPDNKLKLTSPLRELPYVTFSTPENITERCWKSFSFPNINRYIADGTDWLYAPMETYIPVSKCPLAITLHDIQAFETNLPWSHTWEHKLFRWKWSGWVHRVLSDCRIVFTVSEFSKQRMIKLLGADPQKIVVVGNGVDQCFFDMATVDPATLPRPVPQPYTFIIGGLRLRKGANYILGVARELQQQQKELQIVIAGDSEPEYITAAEELPNLHLLGIVPDHDLPRLMRCASSLLFLSHYEGFGIPAIEAMAAGIPPIVSNRASLPEVVGTAGIVVKPEDTATLVDILIQLEQNYHLRQDYSQRGQEHAQYYTWSRCVDLVQKAFYEYI